jgi:hypothetical protein
VSSKTAYDSWLRCVSPEARADGVSAEEAAGIVAYAIVNRPRLVTPWWGNIVTPALLAAQSPVDGMLALYAKFANPARRPGGVIAAAAKATDRSAD